MNRHLDKLIYRVRLGLVRISQPKLRERDSDGRRGSFVHCDHGYLYYLRRYWYGIY